MTSPQQQIDWLYKSGFAATANLFENNTRRFLIIKPATVRSVPSNGIFKGGMK